MNKYKMTQEEILVEIKKCKENPYYFATTYLTVINHRNERVPFTTPLSEKEFNEIYKKYDNRRTRI